MDQMENKRLPIFQEKKGWLNRMKIWKISVAALLLLTYCAVFMQGFAYSTITEEEMDAFLVEQGVPKIAMQKLPFDLKKRIYLGESQTEVGEPTYGVFTDDYKVEYRLR